MSGSRGLSLEIFETLICHKALQRRSTPVGQGDAPYAASTSDDRPLHAVIHYERGSRAVVGGAVAGVSTAALSAAL
jgi:hypothetical protein